MWAKPVFPDELIRLLPGIALFQQRDTQFLSEDPTRHLKKAGVSLFLFGFALARWIAVTGSFQSYFVSNTACCAYLHLGDSGPCKISHEGWTRTTGVFIRPTQGGDPFFGYLKPANLLHLSVNLPKLWVLLH